MAQIAFGIATSHGSLLVTEPAKWSGRGGADRRNPALAYRRQVYNFQELLAARHGEDFESQITLAARQERHARCQRALDELAAIVAAARPDILVIVGDDQHEWFQDAVQPAFSIYCGKQVANLAMTPDEIASNAAEGRLLDPLGYRPPADRNYPIAHEFATHLISDCMRGGFDVAACMAQPRNEPGGGLTSLGHAYGFICRRILGDRPVPIVPVLVNTFYPPNQPTPRRCIDLGRMIADSIRGWQQTVRIGVCASGGLSHFVIDESFDQEFLAALRRNDLQALAGVPDDLYRSGTSECKNWLVVAGMLQGSALQMNLIDYVPCYRTEAGTGNAMGFVTWR